MRNRLFEKSLRKFCQKSGDPDTMMKRLEKTLHTGFDFNTGKICDEYIVHRSMFRATVIPLKNVVWAYKTSIGPAHETVGVNINLDSGPGMYNVQTLFLKHSDADLMLHYIWENCPNIAIGFDDQVNDLCYNQDFEGLKKYAYTQRKENFMNYEW